MKIAAVLFFISAIGTAWSPSLWILVVFRVIGGVGVGVASVIAPAYIAEIAPARIRGRLGSLQQLAIVTGIFISLLVDFVFAQLAGGAGEVLWLGLGGLALDVPGDGRPGCHLRRAGADHPRVAAVPDRQAPDPGGQGDPHRAARATTNLDAKIQRIRETMEREKEPSWADLKTPQGKVAGIVWIGLVLSVFQQFVGINVIFYYSTILWEAVGFSEERVLRHHRHLGDHQRADDADRDRHDRQARPQATAGHRLHRHDRHPRR